MIPLQNSWEANRVANLAASIFSRSRVWPPESTLKTPWQVDRSEWRQFQEPDVRTGGFGPLFPAALVLSLAFLAIRLWRGGAAPWIATASILIIIASVLPVYACWWARYAPQVWLIPLVALAPLGGRRRETAFGAVFPGWCCSSSVRMWPGSPWSISAPTWTPLATRP